MAIKISKELRSKLPDSEKNEIEKLLIAKSGGSCFLCAMPINESGEDVVADHDIPEAEGGKTELKNLNLVHTSCNSFKRNHTTVDVRPFLKLERLVTKAGGFLKYNEAAQLLGFIPKSVEIIERETSVIINFADGVSLPYPVFSEKNKEGTFKYCYVELKPEYIFNDDECQPRSIKLQHLWQIYNDINRNPLHEAPACRIVRDDASVNLFKALLFDGQHKTLAFWIAGKSSIVVKVYLNLSRNAAIKLVNSVQSKIKKLPLSPFELAAKMSEEWQDRVQSYENAIPGDKTSEDGYLKWVDKDERSRAKSAFVDALFQNIIDSDHLEFKAIVLKQGQKPSSDFTINETTFKNKILKNLLHTDPLKINFTESAKLRVREKETIIELLNRFYRKAFKPGEQQTPQDIIRLERLLYQASLSYVFSTIKNVIGNWQQTTDGKELFGREITSERWEEIDAAIQRIVDHPVWTTKFEHSNKLRNIKDALSKNQNAATAFEAVRLEPGYVSGMDKLQARWLED